MTVQILDIETTSNEAVAVEAAPQDFPQSLRLRRIWPALLVMAAAVVMIHFTDDLYHPLYNLTRDLPNAYLTSAKQFVSAFTVTVICATIWVLDRRRRAAIFVLLITLLAAGAVNGTAKFTFGRARPTFSVRLTDENRAWIENWRQNHPRTLLNASRQDQWLGLSAQRPWFKDGYDSFPSGHACVAFVIAAFLIALYPRGRWIWLLIACGCALARVAQRRHFPSDVLFGGGLGWLIAQYLFAQAWPIALGRRLTALLETLPRGTKFAPAMSSQDE
ncbi:MAG: phosphatase PAP2 family protein [bacterium]|nr:phosphatase PAP2 family protein [bacterium]